MKYLEYYDALAANRLISPIWRDVLPLIADELPESENKDDYLILFTILFALNDDGNICMSLDEEKLSKKWNQKLDKMAVLLNETDSLDTEKFDYVKAESAAVIGRSLNKINDENLKEVAGQHKFFEIDNGWIYIRKNNVARRMILSSLDRLFTTTYPKTDFDYKKIVKKGKELKPGQKEFELKPGQQDVVSIGIQRNLVITGGPGTGKTTSILFLLIGLLLNKNYDEVYLLAQSGKAASRMKDSIKSGLDHLDPKFVEKHADIVERIANLGRSTIHSALKIDWNTGAFSYNENNQLAKNSIYIIDEASMIDVCMFASLLSAIPDDARVFIMGDKNQLPSVDEGAVFADLIRKKSLVDNKNIVELGEAVRFQEGSPIYELAETINKEERKLPELPWKDSFLEIQENKSGVINPVYYYLNPVSEKSQKETVEKAVSNFGRKYYSDLQAKCTDLDPKADSFIDLFNSVVKNAAILSAENRGVRGVNTINHLIKSEFIDKSQPTSVEGYYPGELIIVNKNNKLLDLANGDSGVLVTFKGDKTLYFMIEKDSELIKNVGKINDSTFKLGGCLFYPFRMLTRSEISNAYAITIHKSQGSDYNNILVIVPTAKGHPLLNRQIVYTAITRTKGDTYILANQECIEEAKDTFYQRDTNIS